MLIDLNRVEYHCTMNVTLDEIKDMKVYEVYGVYKWVCN